MNHFNENAFRGTTSLMNRNQLFELEDKIDRLLAAKPDDSTLKRKLEIIRIQLAAQKKTEVVA